MKALRYHHTGNTRPHEVRPSDHRGGAWRQYVHGPLQPMQEPSLWARLMGRAGL